MNRTSKTLCLLLAVLMLTGAVSGCANSKQPAGAAPAAAPAEAPVAAPAEAPAEPVVLTVAGAWEDCRAIDAVGRAFTAEYPNCTIQYEYLQNYDEVLLKRMSGENAVDLFFTNSIQEDSPYLPHAQELMGCEGLDLSHTFEGLIENYCFFGGDSADGEKLYSIPLGAEMRGLYINKTLLDSLNIAVPTNQAELVAACETLKENGYIAFHGNPGSFAQTLIYPWICSSIANADDPEAAYDMVNSRAEGLGELFMEPFEFLYSLVENGYYDYKRAQTELNLFVDSTDEAYARDFFNIRKSGEEWVKADDLGQVAFMPYPLSAIGVMDKAKDDYHSEIEYVFVPAPVGVDGGYAYMSPARGIAANKDSANLDWSIRFLNFLFVPENNELFAEEFGIIPNTQDAFSYISSLYDMPDDHISQLGQVTFDYAFYGIITGTLTDISKGNNPKYMQANADGTTSLYPLDYYVDAFEEEIKGDAQ